MLNRFLRSIHTRTLLFLIALLLVLGGSVVVLGAWVTHRLKQHLVEEAREYARAEVLKSGQQIAEVLKREGVRSVRDTAGRPEVQTQVRLLIARSNGSIQMAALISPDGEVVVQETQDNQALPPRVVEPGESVTGPLEGSPEDFQLRIERSALPDTALTESIPISTDDPQHPLGYLQWTLGDLKGSERMQRISGKVTENLIAMVALVLVFLAAALALIYKLFCRHLALEREKEAHEKLAIVGTLASGLAHEIRNPLQVIHMNLDLIREDFEDSAQRNTQGTLRTIAGVQNQIRHLNEILHDFLQYAIPGRMELEDVDLGALVADTLEFLQPELGKHGVETEVQIPSDARIHADPSALRQVFLNILLNAIKAMEEAREKRIAVTAQFDARTSAWTLSFQDTGCGIPAGKKEEIFEAFVSFRPGGTGFGLAIARRIVEEHGGRIEAENNPRGPGAIFRMTLPAAEPEHATATADAARANFVRKGVESDAPAPSATRDS